MGLAGYGTRLSEALSNLGFALADVEQIVVTHTHWDHYTQAIALRDSYGTPVLVGEQEQHTIDAFDTIAGMHPRQVELLRTCGAPPNWLIRSRHSNSKNTRETSLSGGSLMSG